MNCAVCYNRYQVVCYLGWFCIWKTFEKRYLNQNDVRAASNIFENVEGTNYCSEEGSGRPHSRLEPSKLGHLQWFYWSERALVGNCCSSGCAGWFVQVMEKKLLESSIHELACGHWDLEGEVCKGQNRIDDDTRDQEVWTRSHISFPATELSEVATPRRNTLPWACFNTLNMAVLRLSC